MLPLELATPLTAAAAITPDIQHYGDWTMYTAILDSVREVTTAKKMYFARGILLGGSKHLAESLREREWFKCLIDTNILPS